ncbi:gliding motility-associated C-terminal domain-containing protein [bacterium]|nr:gliding motility-associated C-terminal domain-containing protein [bacterium]
MRLLIIIIFLLPISSFSQDLYLKQFDNPTNTTIDQTQMAPLSDGTLIIAANKSNAQNKRSLFITQHNSCGDVLWSKLIEHQTNMRLVDMQVDQEDNTILAGFFDENSFREPYVVSIDKNGSINFFKKYITNTANLSSLTYSLDISTTNEIFVYINYDITTAGPASRPSILKLKSDGTIDWYKLYDFHSWQYGFMMATNDGGALFTMSKTFVKIDSLGNVEWMNEFNGRFNPMKGIETDYGYAFSSFDHSSAIPINFLMLNKDGSVRWNISNLNTFIVRNSTLLSNGNLVYLGMDGSTGVNTILELNAFDGTPLKFKELLPNFSNITLSDLFEDKKGNLYASGITTTQLTPKVSLVKLNDTLSLVNCEGLNYTANYTIDTLNNNPLTLPNLIGNTVIRSSNEVYSTTNQIITTSTLCNYTKDRGNIELGKDTLLCGSETIELGDPNSKFEAYSWSNGATSKTITVNQPGQYILSVLAACDTLRDTITISYQQPLLIDLGKDTSICNGDSVLLQSNTVLPNYTWSNGSTSSTIKVGQTGTYWLESTDFCGSVRDSIEITKIPPLSPLSLGKDTTLCPNESLELTAGVYPNYLWSTNETTSTITAQDSGTYWVEVTNTCDTLRDSIFVEIHPSIEPSFEWTPTVIQTRDSVQFINSSRNSFFPKWKIENNEIYNQDSIIYQFNSPGFYPILLEIKSAEGCQFEVQKTIEVLPSDYTIPNIFTPNGDGINDCFEPVGNDIVSYEFSIINRWGVIIFEGRDVCWDGRNESGENATDGTYFYQLSIYFIDGKKMDEKGTLQLLRD